MVSSAAQGIRRAHACRPRTLIGLVDRAPPIASGAWTRLACNRPS